MKKSVIRNIFSQKHVLTFELQFLSFEKIVKLPVRHMWQGKILAEFLVSLNYLNS